MNITVIYYNKEKKRDIKPAINALVNQKTDFNFQVIVVDDYSQNPYLKNIEDMPLQLISIGHKTGWINLLNLAIDQAKYDILAITDCHCIVSENWLESISKYFGDSNIVSGFVDQGNSFKARFSVLTTHYDFAIGERTTLDNIFDGNFVVRKDYLKEYLNEFSAEQNIGQGTAAYVLAQRISKNGGLIRHEPEIRVWHRSEGFAESLYMWCFIFGPNSVSARHIEPRLKGAKYLKYGPFIPFIFTAGRWLSLTKTFFSNWYKCGIRIYELPVYFLWYNVCMIAYFLGVSFALLKGESFCKTSELKL
jgi:glycosyltransferase involved in cell wall biosynthesis